MSIARALLLSLFLLTIVGCAASDGPGMDARDSDRADQLVRKGIAHLHAGEYDAAEATLRRAVEADAFSGVARNNLGKALFHQNKLYEAARQFEHAASLLPYQPEPHNNLAMVLEAAGRLDQAIDHYRDALEIQPENPELIGNLSRAKFKRGDRDPELRQLLEDLVLKDSRPEWVNWARLKLGQLSGS